jgi:hypothetical protein
MRRVKSRRRQGNKEGYCFSLGYGLVGDESCYMVDSCQCFGGTCCLHLLSYGWRIFSPETLETKLHDVTSQKTIIVIFTATRTSNLIDFIVSIPVLFRT